MNPLSRGLLFVVSAPAGTGKNTLVDLLKQEFTDLVESISYTTRKPRQEEKEGVHYYFIGEDEFKKKIERGDFLEYVHVFDHYYGTDKNKLQYLLDQKKDVILVIDTQGALALRNKIEAIFIFIFPPSIEELRKRLQKRHTEKKDLAERLSWAQKEIDDAKYYDYHLVNDKLEQAYEILRSIFIAEKHRNPMMRRKK